MKILLTKTFVVLMLLTAARLVPASEFDSYLISLPTNITMPEKNKVFRIAHRFNGRVDEDSFENGFGMDTGANIRIQLDYSVTDSDQTTVARSSPQGMYELGWRYVLSENITSWLSVNIPGGAETQTYSDPSYNLGFIGALTVKKLDLFLVPLYVSNSNPGYSQWQDDSMTLAFGGRWEFDFKHRVEWELARAVYGYKGDNKYPASTLAWSYNTGMHQFQINAGNSRNLNTNRVTTTNGILDSNNVFLGFSITRRLF